MLRRIVVDFIIEIFLFLLAFSFYFLLWERGLYSAQVKLPEKPVIDTGVISKWQYLETYHLSPLGRFVCYEVRSHSGGEYTLVVKSTEGKWQKNYQGASFHCFSADDKQLVIINRGRLLFVSLGSGNPDSFVPCGSVSMPGSDSGVWIAYQDQDLAKPLVVANLLTGRRESLGKVSNYAFDKAGTVLLIEDSIGGFPEVRWLDLKNEEIRQIWLGKQGDQIEGQYISDDGHRLVFATNEHRDGKIVRSIWYYSTGMTRAFLKLDGDDPRIPKDYSIDAVVDLSKDGHWIFFSLIGPKPDAVDTMAKDAVMVDIWGYRDKYLLPDQIVNKDREIKKFASAISVEGNIYRQLEYEDQRLETPESILAGDYVVVSRPDSATEPDPRRNYSFLPSYFIVSLRTGKESLLRKGSLLLYNFDFSPGGRWLIFYDVSSENYFSYDTKTQTKRNVTVKLPLKIAGNDPFGSNAYSTVPIYGWLGGDSSFLLHDKFDIWRIDPSNSEAPVNITGAYGQKKHIQLRLATWTVDNRNYSFGDTLLLVGFNTISKQNGFFKCTLGNAHRVDSLFMGPYSFFVISENVGGQDFDRGVAPVKALRSSRWMVLRESAVEAPNLFLTTDFKQYHQITRLAPQEECNWLQAELMNYTQVDGTKGQGILYKPENFDPSKKYPVVFNYYEEVSFHLYQFPRPQLMNSSINIPWFASRGYLVFTPDIYYGMASESGKTAGVYAYNAVVGAANALLKLPYVDGKRLGIEGHSFGAYETNYIVSHSRIFAAASEMAGVTDVVSSYLSLAPVGGDLSNENFARQMYTEAGQARMGATLWKIPQLYVDASPIMHADQIATPMLIVHNKGDGKVPWRQSIELYMALRRLKKRAWLLQYDGETHSIHNPKAALDYSVRLTQFFDHYLKGEPPPKWMTEGIKATMRGKINGYEPDLSGAIP